MVGCLDDQSGSNGPGESDGRTHNDSKKSTDTGTEMTIRETRFEILDIRASNAEESASLAFDGGRITGTGTIRGNNGCYTARIDEIAVEDETLVAGVESFEDATEDQDCTQTIVIIEYRVTIEVDDPVTAVTITHNGEVVATAERS